jgi:alkanesulfonate monooxygenase SsuD/methylene tetrahydromethanopterin reductase-like flavin-dependent oxidoreductase (luciferase family)
MGPVGIRHAAQWADGWMPVDIGLTDVKVQLSSFRQMLVDNGRDPDSVAVTVQTMITPDLDKLKEYRDLGIARIIVGVAVDMWDKPERVMPMIDTFGKMILQLRSE